MKNIDKFNHIKAEAQNLEAALLAGLLANKVAPVVLWQNCCNGGAVEWSVTKIESRHEFIHCWTTLPTNKAVTEAAAQLEKLRAIQAADPMKVTIHIKRGDTSSGVPWARLLDGSYGYYATREEAEVANRKWHEDHDPRPDHFACNYCGKQAHNSKRVCARIFVNRGVQDRVFCSSQCAAYDQFASEG